MAWPTRPTNKGNYAAILMFLRFQDSL